MTDYPLLAEPMFVRLADIQSALLDYRLSATAQADESLLPLVDATITESASPPYVVALVQGIWDAGPSVTVKAKVLAARLALWVGGRRQMGIGNDGTAERMRQAFMRELGQPGEWPAAEDDPHRGPVEPDPVPELPAPEAPPAE